MSTEQRIYQGNLIQKSFSIADGVVKEYLRWYILCNSAGNYGVACEMHESEMTKRNIRLAGAGSDYRWTLVPEKGAR